MHGRPLEWFIGIDADDKERLVATGAETGLARESAYEAPEGARGLGAARRSNCQTLASSGGESVIAGEARRRTAAIGTSSQPPDNQTNKSGAATLNEPSDDLVSPDSSISQ